MAESFSESRLQPMIDDNLAHLKQKDRHKYKKLEYHLTDQTIDLIGGNNALQLSSRSGKHLFADEVDKLAGIISGGKEADPISLFKERAKTYPGRKFWFASTPTLMTAYIWALLEEGSFERYCIPCPECAIEVEDPQKTMYQWPMEKVNKHGYFYPLWSMVKWDKEQQDMEKVKNTAFIECPCCGYPLQMKDHQKRKLLFKGVWVQTNFNAQRKKKSYHYTEILSPFTPLGDLVVKFIEASVEAKRGNTGPLQNFINSSLSECWDPGLGKQKKTAVFDSLIDIGRPRDIVPDDALSLIAGADTQDVGFYYSIHAFGRYNESWLVREGFVDDLDSLEKVTLGATYMDRLGRHFPVEAIAIDSQGHRTDDVYEWCEKMGHAAYAINGMQKMATLYSYRAVAKSSKGLLLWSVNTNHFKNMIDRRLLIQPGDPGQIHLYEDCSEDYKKQMVAEYIDPDTDVWVCPDHLDNHYFDCSVYAYFLAEKLGIQHYEEYEPTAPESISQAPQDDYEPYDGDPFC